MHQPKLGLLQKEPAVRPRDRAPTLFSGLAPARPTEVYDTFWYFAAERQAVFFERLKGRPYPWTEDPILKRYKFTNAYRASDRVSQYLIQNVIYGGDQDAREVFFRTILFKIFNRIGTWEMLEEEFGCVSYADYSFEEYDALLTRAIESGRRIFSAAYIMPSGGKRIGRPRKHSRYLELLGWMMEDGLPESLTEARNMREAFELLRGYPMIGDFLAYQYATDLNYSEITDFGEMEFVMPGPGARNGIHKCFEDLGGLSEVDIIKVVAERQEEEFERLGLEFESLWGRPLQLIDCQNLFCEVDKYARVAHPYARGVTHRMRIKQTYSFNPEPVSYWYPPKWGINHLIPRSETEA
ncbi:hypothetical protein GBA65_07000 [Rubrobacter marinus]|uniref:5-hmdU DNA kinase helical domain-containing protein n=1 Tax=Rubrobacter marinus TaxID=2653852 RepID=A0A6G8PVR8_9ACTN|nr:nucleotide kinase domain-containing protein [Rubrobacter marinus]QIN78302.1 hypothetical protein GBA65_07000 [Rubrobacter marinus]